MTTGESSETMTGEDFDTVRDALDALAEGRVSEERVREEFGGVDDIGYSISVAVAHREQDLDEGEWRESFSADFEIGEGDGIDWPDSSEAEERERLAELADEELRSELERIEKENAEWRNEYDVESPRELQESVSEEMEADERERRREAAYDWRHNEYTRDLILDVLGEQDS